MKKIFLIFTVFLSLALSAQKISVVPTSTFYTPFKVDLSRGINTASPKKLIFKEWTTDSSYPVLYAAQNIPGADNYFLISDSTFNKLNGYGSLILAQGAQNLLTVQGVQNNIVSSLANGIINIGSSPSTATALSNGFIPQLKLGSLTYSFTGGTVPLAYQIQVQAANIKSNSATTVTEWATATFPKPTFDAGVTPTRVFGITTNTDVSIAGRTIIGLASTVPSATLQVQGTMSVSSSATLGSSVLISGTSTVQAVRAAGAFTAVTSVSVGTNFSVSGTCSLTGAVTGAANISSSSKTGGIGYAVGSGSTVTQATSRTTGVTINAITGNITLFTTAGSTSPQSFLVTNSAVAATDVPIVCQKSGTDKYTIDVTAVNAGSFEITFNTKSGTTSEAPVFSFAIIKGQTN